MNLVLVTLNYSGNIESKIFVEFLRKSYSIFFIMRTVSDIVSIDDKWLTVVLNTFDTILLTTFLQMVHVSFSLYFLSYSSLFLHQLYYRLDYEYIWTFVLFLLKIIFL